MSDSFRRAAGRKVVSRANAQDLGAVGHLVVDVERRAVVGVVVGKGKKGQLVAWDQVTGFGPDAVMVTEAGALRAPGTERERLAADGKLELVGKRVLTDSGNALGTLDDVTFDPASGALELLHVAAGELEAPRLLGSGSYAVVVSDDAPSG